MKSLLNFSARSLLFVIIGMFFSLTVSAQSMGLVVGVRGDSGTSDNTSVNWQGMTNYQFGGVANFEVGSGWFVRSGFIYAQRGLGLSSTTYNLTYVDIPVGMFYKFNDFGGAFVGANLGFNANASCGASACAGIVNNPIGYQFGLSFKFAPMFGMQLYYESMGKLMTNLDLSKAVVLNLLVAFD